MMKTRILLVDDDNGHRQMLKVVLEEWDYTITEAIDGEMAVEQVKKAPVDLILMDVRMPKKSGLEALLEIKAINPSIPILIMTAYSTVEAAVETIKAGAYDYLTKPLDFEKLKITLRNILSFSGLIKENAQLSASLAKTQATSNIIGSSPAFQKVLTMVETVAPSEATILITGESGTGKEVIAKAIHELSGRCSGPYVAINCAALTETLLESELFGHEKGAFTGADRRHNGRFSQAHKGTLFLDEIGEMPLLMQAKLLRAIQEKEIVRVGGSTPEKVDVRLVAATNRDILQEVEAGNFREDLYYRLNVVSIELPPLRKRNEDIPALASHFLQLFSQKNNKTIQGFTPSAMHYLMNYSWPGNVRELENIVERGVVLCLSNTITERELPDFMRTAGNQPNKIVAEEAPPLPLEDIEKTAILYTLNHVGGNKSEAAKLLGITRKTLHAKLQKYNNEESS